MSNAHGPAVDAYDQSTLRCLRGAVLQSCSMLTSTKVSDLAGSSRSLVSPTDAQTLNAAAAIGPSYFSGTLSVSAWATSSPEADRCGRQTCSPLAGCRSGGALVSCRQSGNEEHPNRFFCARHHSAACGSFAPSTDTNQRSRLENISALLIRLKRTPGGEPVGPGG
jgi:hypothetical protein